MKRKIDWEDLNNVENQVLKLLKEPNTVEEVFVLENMLHKKIGWLCAIKIKELNNKEEL